GLFLCLAFSILNVLDLCCAAGCLFLYFWFRFSFCLGLSFRLSYSTRSCLEFSRLWGSLYLLNCRSFLGLMSLTGNQALAIRYNIINREEGEFLAMATAMAITLLGLVLENNYLFAATLFGSSCQHHCVGYQRTTDHRIIRIRDK